MSGLPSRLETVTKKQFITIPQAVAALANMERELDSAESYAQIRKLADAAEALKILFRHVAEVKNKAELVVLAANVRIGEEIKLIPEGEQASISHGWEIDKWPWSNRHSAYQPLAPEKIEFPAHQRELAQAGADAAAAACTPPVRERADSSDAAGLDHRSALGYVLATKDCTPS